MPPDIYKGGAGSHRLLRSDVEQASFTGETKHLSTAQTFDARQISEQNWLPNDPNPKTCTQLLLARLILPKPNQIAAATVILFTLSV